MENLNPSENQNMQIPPPTPPKDEPKTTGQLNLEAQKARMQKIQRILDTRFGELSNKHKGMKVDILTNMVRDNERNIMQISNTISDYNMLRANIYRMRDDISEILIQTRLVRDITLGERTVETAQQWDDELHKIDNEFLGVEDLQENDTVKFGDLVVVKFAGKDDNGKPLPNAAGEDELILGTGRLISDLEKHFEGMSIGQKKENCSVKFPENYNQAHLRNKEATFDIELVSARRKIQVKDSEENNG